MDGKVTRETPDQQKPVTFSTEMIEKLIEQGKLDDARKLIDLYTGLKSLRKDEEERERARQMQLAQFQAIQAESEYRAAMQEACRHLKENGRPSIGGMKDSRGATHYICLRCQKEWVDDELPQYLRNNLPEIGGPMT